MRQDRAFIIRSWLILIHSLGARPGFSGMCGAIGPRSGPAGTTLCPRSDQPCMAERHEPRSTCMGNKYLTYNQLGLLPCNSKHQFFAALQPQIHAFYLMDRYVTPLPSSESLKALPPRGNIPLGISCWSSFVSHLTTVAVTT